MRFFCRKDDLHGTDCHEFFPGEWDGRFWDDDSIYIYDELFSEMGVKGLLRRIMTDYSPYDPTVIYPNDWDELRRAATGETAAVLRDADDWARRSLKQHGCFTILGI